MLGILVKIRKNLDYIHPNTDKYGDTHFNLFEKIKEKYNDSSVWHNLILCFYFIFLFGEIYSFLAYFNKSLEIDNYYLNISLDIKYIIAFILLCSLILYFYSDLLPSLIKRFSLYCVLFFSSMSMTHYIFSLFGFGLTDVDSARYMLSTLIQSEAAIFGLVITLSLVAVQQSATSYSPKIIGIFKDPRINLDFYILSCVYICLIMYEMWILKEVKTDSLSPAKDFNYQIKVLPPLERQLQMSFSVTIFAFLSLILYTLNILNLLRPIKIIDVFSRKITEKKITDFVNDGYVIPVQPLMDVVKASLSRYDYETSIVGIKSISDVSLPIFKDKLLSDKEATKIIKNFFSHIEGICKFAEVQKDQDTLIEILKLVNNIAEIETKKGNANATIQILFSIDNLVAILSDNNMKSEMKKVVKILDEIGKEAISKNMNLQVFEKIFSSLIQIGDFAIKYNYVDLLHTVVVSISKIGSIFWKQNKLGPVIKIIWPLRDILIYCVNKNIKRITIEVEDILLKLIMNSTKENTEKIILEVIQVQKEIGELVLRDKNDSLLKTIKSTLEEIKKIAISRDMQNIQDKIEILVESYPPN